MLKTIIDLILSVIFLGTAYFGFHDVVVFVEKEVVTKIAKGISPVEPFTRKSTRKKFDWEK